MLNTISFVVNVYRQYNQLDMCLADFRKAYPNNQALLIVDGCTIDYQAIAKRYNLKLLVYSRCKIIKFGGLWTHRYLDSALKLFKPTDWLLKFDPDTVFNRPLSTYPDGYNLASSVPKTLFKSQEKCKLYGGVTLFRWSFAEKLVANKLFLKQKYINNPKYTMNWNGEMVTFQDRIFTDILNNLNESVYDHSEISALYQATPTDINTPAIFHPRKA